MARERGTVGPLNGGPLAIDGHGNELLRFVPGTEAGLDRLDPDVSLPLSLVPLWNCGSCLVVFDRWKQSWELPGGTREDGETPRDATRRELFEETGERPARLDYVGVATIQFAVDGRLEFAVVYSGATDEPTRFVPNNEIERVLWWDVDRDLLGMSAIDARLARYARL